MTFKHKIISARTLREHEQLVGIAGRFAQMNESAVRMAFGNRVAYGQIVKSTAGPDTRKEAAHRYSPLPVIAVNRTAISGVPTQISVNTRDSKDALPSARTAPVSPRKLMDGPGNVSVIATGFFDLGRRSRCRLTIGLKP
jgi:hypothetical protein